MSLRKNVPPTRLIPIFSMLLGLGIFIYALASFTTPARAAPVFQEDKPANDFCLACHQEEGIDITLGKESLPVTINPTQFNNSVHAEEGFNCVDCHTDISDYPHPDVKVKNVRDFTLTFTETCKECHEEQYINAHDSVHQKALDEGNKDAAVCMDCHNPHT